MKPHKRSRRSPHPASTRKLTFFFVCAVFLMTNAAVIWVQNEFSQRLITHIRQEAASHGVEFQDVELRCAGFSSFNSLRWKSVRGQIKLSSGENFPAERLFSVTVRSLDAAWLGFFPPLFEIRANGVEILSNAVSETLGTETARDEKMNQGMLRFQAVYHFWNVTQARREAGALFNKLLDLLRTGKTPLSLDFKGIIFFKVYGTAIQVTIESHRKKGVTFLRIPAQDLIRISTVLDESLTSQEIRILSENPLQVPQLLKIRNYARTVAYRAGKTDGSVPKDAYRHVLWSYLLTREFGAAFSERVTRAHEMNAVLHNTAAQTSMDFNNNAVGRRYAQLGYEESTILKRLMKDPAVIRYSTPQKGK